MRDFKRYFLTFSQGDWLDAGLRISNQASKLKLFDQVISLTDKSIEYGIRNLIEKNKYFIEKNPKGYGLWFWKPHICEAVLSTINYGDVLFYSDSGCELTNEGKFLIDHFLNFVNKNGSIFFSLPLSEKFWTNEKLIKVFEKKIPTIGDQMQIQATFFILRKDIETVRLIKAWKRLTFRNKFRVLKDQDSDNSFAQHRHDQSVLSLLVKYLKMNIYPFDLHVPNYAYFNGSIALYLPIHPVRNKKIESSISKLEISNSTIKNLTTILFIIKKHMVIYMCRYSIPRRLIKFVRKLRNKQEI